MKSFRTELHPRPADLRLRHEDALFTIGSCFADAIGQRLLDHKFKVMVNPFGALFNPLSIHRALLYAVHNELPLPASYLQNQGSWRNSDFHSSLSGNTRTEVEQTIGNAIGTSHHFLKDAKSLILTYGTARVYERLDTGAVVANCHKLPGSNFQSHWLSPESIRESFESFYSDLKKWNPEINVLLTVSPVRHIKDTLEADSAGKSSLRWACHEISSQFPDVEYFPAYEIMMDDLRDYRFYAADMIHPSQEAVDYIWGKFADTFFDHATKRLVMQWEELSLALRHRPFHPEGEAHQKFLTATLRKLEELNHVIPVREEIAHIKDQLQQTS